MTKVKWDPAPGGAVWNRLKSLRKEKKLTQPQVAVGANVSVTVIWMIEQGFEARVTDETKMKIAKFFEVDVGDIFPAQMVGNIPKEQFFLKAIEKK